MKSIFQLTVLLALVSMLGCGGTSADPTAADADEAASNVSESAMADTGQQATASEGASTPGFISASDVGDDIQSMDFLDPQDTVHAAAACTFTTARSNCTSNVDTITWGGCNVGSAILTGGWTETWSAGFCGDGTKPGALTNGTSVTRTSSGQTLTLLSGAALTMNTTAHSTYDGTAIPGTGIQTSNAAGTRTIVVNGLHKVLTAPRGRTWFDHTITSTGLTVTGTRAGGNRVVTGNSTLYHNLAKYKAVHTFNSVTWGSSACCYPTSGSISSTITGTRSGNVSLAFTATCGQANFTNTDSTTSNVTLSQCN